MPRTFPLGGKWPAGPDEGAACGMFAVNGIPQSPPCGGDSPLSQGGPYGTDLTAEGLIRLAALGTFP